MTATITRTTAPPVPLDEAEAAQLEALADMPADLVTLRNRKLELDEEVSARKVEIDRIKAIFDARLQADNVQGYVLNGKVHGRRSEVTTTRVDSALLKEKHPRIYKAFLKVTKSVRITIN